MCEHSHRKDLCNKDEFPVEILTQLQDTYDKVAAKSVLSSTEALLLPSISVPEVSHETSAELPLSSLTALDSVSIVNYI